ncbi:MAG: hypothetical protein IKU57_00205 [Oscillospiraceae bacterium]|nr:hypothetical protein [Oscillospiraceae bacterium]
MAVKGISRQVIVVQSPDPKLFDQAIFILKDNNVGVSEAQLIREAGRLIGFPQLKRKTFFKWRECMLLGIGASVTGLVWLITAVF